VTEPSPSFDSLLDAVSDERATRARTIAFALVTAYDHDVSDHEVERFGQLIGGDGEAFRALATTMKGDLDGATEWARGYLADERGDPRATRAIVEAARIAAIADAQLAEREEIALHVVAVALGLDPDEV